MNLSILCSEYKADELYSMVYSYKFVALFCDYLTLYSLLFDILSAMIKPSFIIIVCLTWSHAFF